MAKSDYKFNRWEHRHKSSWALRIFKQHTNELLRMFITFNNSKEFTYKNLKSQGAKWEDKIDKYFKFVKWEYDKFDNLKDWSNGYNELENWINLNALVSMSSSFETYIATIVPLALESDIGVLFGTSHKIDGMSILKYGKSEPFDFNNIVIGITKGDWNSRIAIYKKTFDNVPKYLESNISSLEKIRKIRNDLAHAFGRDIEASRDKFILKSLPIKSLSKKKFLKYQNIIWKCALEIDAHLTNLHIGEYQSLLFYHKLFPTLNQNLHINQRAIELRKKIGQYGDQSAGKEFCQGLVKYYESL
ncbi:hypothetical protein L5F09_01565 [Aliarcobacter butzleri]|uniref:hypothetical protein n=1 Tax=Aliarcobacter butzleri TaxID=28197 RepID=UPI001EDAF2B2|nr:hypothetical protein [Aliarcobacter butzleri]MCG3664433.1 hypothetical protein [Aliarcobacter butzleri]